MSINISNQPPTYNPQAVQHMRDELIRIGFEELLSVQDVEQVLKETKGTLLVMINSVCGCAAGTARPGISLALQHKVIPDKITTVFAGQEKDATDRVRLELKDYMPSSPAVALFKNGNLNYYLERTQIEGLDAAEVANILIKSFDQFCDKKGPSIPEKEYAQLEYEINCSSSIPRN